MSISSPWPRPPRSPKWTRSSIGSEGSTAWSAPPLPSSCRRSSSAKRALVASRDNPDLDLVGGPRERGGEDRRTRRSCTRRDPSLPDAIHLLEGRHVCEPDGGREELALVRFRLREQRIDEAQDFAGLLGDALALRVGRHLAREINGLVVDDHLRHARAAMQAFNGHDFSPR